MKDTSQRPGNRNCDECSAVDKNSVIRGQTRRHKIYFVEFWHFGICHFCRFLFLLVFFVRIFSHLFHHISRFVSYLSPPQYRHRLRLLQNVSHGLQVEMSSRWMEVEFCIQSLATVHGYLGGPLTASKIDGSVPIWVSRTPRRA